jgi:GT2 family glycosyltransferase
MSVTAAIPSYNGRKHLEHFIPRFAGQGFDRVYILDDASTDGTAEWLRGEDRVELIAGDSNLGAPGNRNRVLGRPTSDVIVFIDADMDFRTDGVAAAIARYFAAHPRMAVMGAVILSHTDDPMWWNCGYDRGLHGDGFAEALNRVALAHWNDPEVMSTVRELARGRVAHFEEVADREVDWVIEGFFAVRTKVFRQLGGFDPGFRMFHDGPDYCRRARNAGYTVRFNPEIRLKHLDMCTGTSEQRAGYLRASTLRWYQKHYGLSAESAARVLSM